MNAIDAPSSNARRHISYTPEARRIATEAWEKSRLAVADGSTDDAVTITQSALSKIACRDGAAPHEAHLARLGLAFDQSDLPLREVVVMQNVALRAIGGMTGGSLGQVIAVLSRSAAHRVSKTSPEAAEAALGEGFKAIGTAPHTTDNERALASFGQRVGGGEKEASTLACFTPAIRADLMDAVMQKIAGNPSHASPAETVIAAAGALNSSPGRTVLERHHVARAAYAEVNAQPTATEDERTRVEVKVPRVAVPATPPRSVHAGWFGSKERVLSDFTTTRDAVVADVQRALEAKPLALRSGGAFRVDFEASEQTRPGLAHGVGGLADDGTLAWFQGTMNGVDGRRHDVAFDREEGGKRPGLLSLALNHADGTLVNTQQLELGPEGRPPHQRLYLNEDDGDLFQHRGGLLALMERALK